MGSSIALKCEVHHENCINDFWLSSATGHPLDAFGACASHPIYFFMCVDTLDGLFLDLSCRSQPHALVASQHLER